MRARRLKQIAAYINATHGDRLRASVTRGYASTDRSIGRRLRWPGKGRHGNRLIVETRHGNVLLDHNAAETYRSNDEVEEWLATWEREHHRRRK